MTKAIYVFYALVALSLALVAVLLYLALAGSARLPEPGSSASLLAIFAVGLFTGFHCVGMCGGFCAAAAKTKQGVAVYLGAKTFSYVAIGVLLGALGSVVAISTEVRAALAVFAGIFMVVYALNVLGVGFARKMYGMLPRLPVGGGHSGPAVAGLLNGFMPCGPLQAMQVYALSTASPVQGGLVMLVFALGTLPVMGGFGFIASMLDRTAKASVFRASAVLVLVLGLLLLMNGASSFAFSAPSPAAAPSPTPEITIQPTGDVQVVRSELYGYGYAPSTLNVTAGKPVRWIIDVKELTGCNSVVKIPSHGIQRQLHYGENIIELPAMERGTVEYGCGMWMLRGSIIVR